MFYDDLNTEEQVSYLIKPILQVLQEAGGQLERSEIRDRISELDEHIAEFEQKLYTSNKTGNQYKKFDFKFNFAIKELSYVGLISYVKFNPKITLTQDGANVDLTDFDVKTEVRDKARSYWEEHSTKNKSKNKPVETLEVEDEENESTDDELLDDFKVKLRVQSLICLQQSLNNFHEHFLQRWEWSLPTKAFRCQMMVALMVMDIT